MSYAEQCAICGRDFDIHTQLVQHLKKRHPIGENETKSNRSKAGDAPPTNQTGGGDQ